MAGYLTKLSDWDLLDMAEGLRYPTSLEKEMAIRLRRRLEIERQQIEAFNSVFNREKEKQK